MELGTYSFSTEQRRQRKQRKKKALYIFGIIVVGIGFGTLLFWLVNGRSFKGRGDRIKPSDVCSLRNSEKFDCHPDRPISEKECLNRGCCFQSASDRGVSDFDLIDSSYLGVPSCYYPKNYNGYDIANIFKNEDRIAADLKRKLPSGFPKDIQKVHLDITFIDDASLRIKLTDADSTRFEPEVPLHHKVVKKRKELYDVDLEQNGLLTVKRKSNGAVVFKTKLSQLVFSDQFLQLSSYTSSSYLYGLGEQKEGLLRSFNWTRYTLFNQGDLPVPHRNLYGSHPFYLVLEPGGNANGVFLLNSNAMDAVLQPAPAISLRPIGGIFDLFIMLGPTPSDVIQQYTGIVGRPFMIPYWSLGFQICKYGYFSLNKTDEVLQRNLDAGVPIDVQWHDIDFMDNHLDFTYDPVNFDGLPEWVDGLHRKGMRYIAMISPGVSNTEPPGNYTPYDDAEKLNLFVLDSNGKAVESKVWNSNFSVYPDFSNPATPAYWTKQFEDYHSKLHFDGVWLDMNEPLNFLNGSDHGCDATSIDNPPYLPGRPYPLRTLTICMNSKHNSTIHYNEHNLLAYREAAATYQAMKGITNKRPFIISRATFSGQGVHSGHWSGDITSDWDDLRYTIPSMLLFNMYGMPMIGSDICGFRLNTTEELCTRWQALGAFYPFSRNHNDFDTIEQDPAAMGGSVLKATLDNLRIRYYLLPYFYTLFHRSHVYGETTVRPLFMEFSNDANVYNIDEEFLWGAALLFMPALYPGLKEINPYYPKGLWYDFSSGQKFESKGERRILQADLTVMNIAVRGGYVLPLQLPAKTTTTSRKNDFDLLVALNEKMEASGELYWDDGESLDTYESGFYNKIDFVVKNNCLTSLVKKQGYNETMSLNEVKVYGIAESPTKVTINKLKAYFEFKKPILSITATGYTLLDLTIIWS